MNASSPFRRQPPNRFRSRPLTRRKHNARAHLRFEILEQRRLLSADLGSLSSATWSRPDLLSSLTWFETIENVDRVPLQSLSRVDRLLGSGVAGPREQSVGEWIVQLSAESSSRLHDFQDADQLLGGRGVDFTLISGLGSEGLLLVRGQGGSQAEIESDLASNANIVEFSLNRLVQGQATTPTDPEFVGGLLPGLEKIDAATAWDESIGTLSTVVGVVDSGIDPEHPDLYLNIWVNQGELPPQFIDDIGNRLEDIDGDGLITFYDLNNVIRSDVAPFELNFGGWQNGPNAEFVRDLNDNGRIEAHDLLADANWADGRDTDGNGFFDDFFGVNFRAGAGDPFAENDPTDELGHGTHVAGTIGAIGGNGIGVVGVNWQTSLMSLRILDNNNQGDSGAAIRAVNYAKRMREQLNADGDGRVTQGANVRVLNNSWGQPGGFEKSLETAIADSGDAGILFVAAAGNGNILGQGVDNDRTPFYPASYESANVIAVSSSDSADRLATFSNFGANSVDLVAPGVGIRSTVPGGGYQSANGTSMAAPHVSGTAALIWATLPESSVDEVRQAILHSVSSISQASVVSTGGRLNAGAAIPAGVFAPSARLIPRNDITSAGGTSTEFTVQYSHRSGIDPTTIGDNDLVVTRSWGRSEPVSPTLVPGSLVASIDGQSVFASYELPAPGDAVFQSAVDPKIDVTTLEYASVLSSQSVDIVDNTTITSDILVENLTDLTSGISVSVNIGSGDVSDLIVRLVAPNGISILLAALAGRAIFGGGRGANFTETTFSDSASRGIEAGDAPFHGVYRPEESLSSLGVTDPNGVWTLEITEKCTFPDFFCSSSGVVGALREWSLAFPTGKANRLISELVVSDVSQATADFTVSFDTSFAAYDDVTATLIGPGGNRVILVGNQTAVYQSRTKTTFDDAAEQAVLDVNSPLVGVFRPQESLSGLAADGPNGTWTLELEGNIDVRILPELRWSLDFIGSWDVLDYGDYLITTSPGSVTAADGTQTSDRRDIGSFRVQIEDPSVDYVDSFADSLEAGSLRSAIIAANTAAPQPRTIILNSGRYTIDIPPEVDSTSTFPDPPAVGFDRSADRVASWSNATTGDFDILGVVKIIGDNNDDTVIDALGVDRVLKVHPNASLALSRLTVQGGTSPATQGGGGILSAGDLSLDQVILQNNVVLSGSAKNPSYGGGIAVWGGDAKIYETRITNNESDLAGGLFFTGASTGSIQRSTVDTNRQGGLLSLSTNDLSVTNSTFSKNSGEGGAISRGFQGFDGSSEDASQSDDGRFVAFSSFASNLVPGDRNGNQDVFVYDREQRTLERVSVNSDREEGNSTSGSPSLSADGRFVSFVSNASNLVPGDSNNTLDIFVYDRQLGTIVRVNVSANQEEANDVSFSPSISSDGRFVTFSSEASNLVPGDTNAKQDIFVYDRLLATMERVSISTGQQEADDDSYTPSVSADGRFVTFSSEASNLIPADMNGENDIFVYDRQAGAIERVSVNADGEEADDDSYDPAVSADGRYITFESDAGNLVPQDTNATRDIFVFDRQDGSIQRVSGNLDGEEADDDSYDPSLSADGRFVAFSSDASDLVPADSNGQRDIFLYDRQTGTTERISVDADGKEGVVASRRPSLSSDGRSIAFQSAESLFVPGDINGETDIFVFDRLLGSIESAPMPSGTVTVSHSTIAQTTQALASIFGDVLVDNSLFAGNVVPSEVSSDFELGRFSLQLLDTELPLLGPLTRLSHLPPVHPLLQGNPGIDAASPSSVGTVDQLRRLRFEADVGAVEAVFASVGGSVFADLNRNGVRDQGEDGISGISVLSRNSATDTVETQISSESDSGQLTFEPFSPETYSFTVVAPTGWSPFRPKPIVARSADAETDQESLSVSLSGDGRFVAFDSLATNLVPEDNNGGTGIGGFILGWDSFVLDREQQTLDRISVDLASSSSGGTRTSISSNGRVVAFQDGSSFGASSIDIGEQNIFSFDRQQASFEPVSVSNVGESGDDDSRNPSLSEDGRFVAFQSEASNLVPGDNNGVVDAIETGPQDIFVYDRQSKTIERVNLSSDLQEANGTSFSPDLNSSGRIVSFASDASNLVPGDNNGTTDIFVVDRQRETIERVSINSAGEESDGTSGSPSVNGDGRFVAFASDASNLVPGDGNSAADVFVYDRQTGTIERVSINASSQEGNDASEAPSLSADGRFVAFASDASNLVPDDNNDARDVFVYDREAGVIARVSVDADQQEANGDSDLPSISGNGDIVAFESDASNLVTADGNGIRDVVVVSNPLSQPSINLMLLAGSNFPNLDLGLVPDRGIISGSVFEDLVSNGVHDPGEPGFANVAVFLDINANGALDGQEPTVQTDADGGYQFLDVDAHRPYSIAVQSPAGFEQVAPSAAEQFSWNIFLPAAGTVTERGFAFRLIESSGQSSASAINGRLFEDRNDDGEYNVGVDLPVTGREVFLDASNFGVRDTNEPRVLTDSEGRYSFVGLSSRNVAVTTTSDETLVHVSPLGSDFRLQTFPLFSSVQPFGGPQAIAKGDFNQDGWLDVAVVLGEANKLSIRLNDGEGGFLPDQIDLDLGDAGSGPTSIVVGWFNDNDDLDVALTANFAGNVTVLLDFDPDSLQFGSRATVTVGREPLDIAAGQFDGDSNLDLAVVNKADNTVQLLINDGAGGFTAGLPVPTGGNAPVSIVVGDFTGDALPDVAVVHASPLLSDSPFGGVTILSGDGASGLTGEPNYYEVGALPIDSSSADFNGDGRMDLAVTNFSSNSISILLALPDGTMRVQDAILGTSSGAFDIAVADIDNDGDVDVIASNLRDRNISVFRNTGVDPLSSDVQFEPLENIGLGLLSLAQRMPLVVANFDNDASAPGGEGTIDIVTIPQETVTLHVLNNRLVDGSFRVALTGLNTVTGLDFIVTQAVLPPMFDVIPDPAPIVENATVQTIRVTGVTKGRVNGPGLAFSVTSSNPAVINNPNVTFVDGSDTATVRYQPIAGASGTSILTVRAIDAGADELLGSEDDGIFERTFTVTILPVNVDPGVVFLTPFIANTQAPTSASILVVSPSNGTLNFSLDLNQDGDWDDGGEQVLFETVVSAGRNLIGIQLPTDAAVGQTYARVQMNTLDRPTTVNDYELLIVDGSSAVDLNVDLTKSGPLRLDNLGQDVRLLSGELVVFSAPRSAISNVNFVGEDGRLALHASLAAFSGFIDVVATGFINRLQLGGNGTALDLTAIDDANLKGVDVIDLLGSGLNRLTLNAAEVLNLSESDLLRLIYDSSDSVQIGDGWEFGETTLEGGAVVHTFMQSGAVLSFETAEFWENPVNRFDVNANGSITSLDALMIVNELGRRQVLTPDGRFKPLTPLSLEYFRFFDVDGNDRLSAVDALQIINAIGRSRSLAMAEPEMVLPGTVVKYANPLADSTHRDLEASGIPLRPAAKLVAVGKRDEPHSSSPRNSTVTEEGERTTAEFDAALMELFS